MKIENEMLSTPDGLTLDQIMQRFNTDEAARAYWESIHWPHGAVCPHCENKNQKTIWKIEANKEKKIRAGLHQCGKCNKQFTSTIGTIFEDSHIPLRKWLVAFYLNSASKKGISSLQLQRILALGSYRTALFMQHRIRHALRDPIFNDKLSGTVEVDETYVGGKQQGVGRGSKKGKVPVVALLERGGRVRSQVMRHVTGANLKQVVKDNVAICSDVNTDDHYGYRGLEPKFNHHVVKHSAKEYVRREKNRLVTTNGVEGFFSLLKRGVMGTFHHISEQHLPLYLAEFDHRHNFRDVAIARQMGADYTINFRDYPDRQGLVDAVNAVTKGMGAHFAFQVTGVPAAASTIWKLVRRGGGICEVGFFVDGGECSINPHEDICKKEIMLVGSWAYNSWEYPNAYHFLQRAARIGIPVEKLITHRFPLDQIAEAFQTNLRLEGIKIVVENPNFRSVSS